MRESMILRLGCDIGRYPETAMAVRKITVLLDEEFVRRARLEDASGAGKSDEQIVEDALMVFLGLRALEDARAQGTLSPEEADRLAVDEVKARRSRQHAA
jgi:hypothetical protein